MKKASDQLRRASTPPSDPQQSKPARLSAALIACRAGDRWHLWETGLAQEEERERLRRLHLIHHLAHVRGEQLPGRHSMQDLRAIGIGANLAFASGRPVDLTRLVRL